jgi:hypothetical protein
MSGTIPLSLSQQLDEFGKPLNGGKLYIIQAGTVATPQDSFQDSALTIKLPNPITLDAAGRLPQFFIADAVNGASGLIKIRLTDSSGVIQREADGIQVVGPSGGGGGGAGVDPNALVQTGNLIARYGVGIFTGYVRLNGLTMGNATSGATERANADVQALWIYLYGVDPNLTVSGGRTGNALNDFNSSKTILVPDWRGCALSAFDDMGNAAAGRLTAGFFGVSALSANMGAMGGGESLTQSAAQMPSHYHAAGIYDPTHVHPSIVAAQVNNTFQTGTAPNPCTYAPNQNIAIGAAATGVRVNSSNGIDTTYSAGGGAAMRTLGPRKLCTFYMKL